MDNKRRRPGLVVACKTGRESHEFSLAVSDGEALSKSSRHFSVWAELSSVLSAIRLHQQHSPLSDSQVRAIFQTTPAFCPPIHHLPHPQGEQPLLVIRDVGIVTVSISWGQLGVVSEVGHKRHRRSWSGTSHYHLSPYPLSSPTSHTNVVLEPSMDQVWCCPSPNSPISIFPHPCSKDL